MWHFDCLFSVFLFYYFLLLWNLLNSSSTQFLLVFCVVFFAFYTTPFSSKHFFLGLFVRSWSTQLFLFVVLLLLLLSMNAFSYVGLLSLFWVWLFHALYLSHLPPSSFLEGLSSEQFAELGSVHLLAFSAPASSLAFLFSLSPNNLQGRFHILSFCCCCCFVVFWWGGGGGGGRRGVGGCSLAFLSKMILLISAILRAHFSYFSHGFFLRLLLCFSYFWFCYF